jgi:hypothetical protein
MKYCLLILSVVVALAACKKVETPQSRSEMLQAGKWKLAENVLKGKRVFNKDTAITYDSLRLKDMPECRTDDYLEFREYGEGALNTGEIKCPQGETSEVALRYGFSSNDMRMFIYGAGDLFYGNDDVDAAVESFSETNFTISYFVVDNTTAIPKKDTTWYIFAFKRF